MTDKLRQTFYCLSWDTRGRNLDVIKVLKPILREDSTLLDAGCGEYGLASLLPSEQFTGVDIVDSMWQNKNFKFLRGSILSLPFSKESFSVATSVDVLEHLPTEIREQAIAELVRVSRNAVVIAFPFGTQAQQIDENFAEHLKRLDKPQPDWLNEHLHSPYPQLETVISAIEAEAGYNNKKVNIKTFYSESIQITRLLRWAAIRSKFLYLTFNLLAGLMHPIVPQTNRNNSYRVILLAEFS